MSLNLLGTVILSLAGLWLFGGFLLRVGGLLMVLTGALALALGSGGGSISVIALGGLAWLAGHWHYALRHREYKSPLVALLFCRCAPAWLDPTRDGKAI
jgi:hypothetical protein